MGLRRILSNVSGDRFYHVSLVSMAIGMVNFGYDSGVIGGVLETPEFQSAMGYPNVTTNTMLVAVFALASWFGSMVAIFLGSSRGRRETYLIGSVVMSIGSLVGTTSYSSGQLMAGRTLMGVGMGLLTAVAPIYVSEMAVDPKRRSRGPVVLIAVAESGIALCYWIDFGTVFAHGSQVVWRLPVALQLVFPLIGFPLVYLMPDTPRWYYMKGRMEEADSVLSRLCDNKPISDPIPSKCKNEILASLELQHSDGSSLRFRDFIWDTSDLKAARRIMIGVAVGCCDYFMGPDFVAYYTVVIFQEYMKLPPLTASGLAGFANTLLAIGGWSCFFLIEMLPRRTWLIGGGTLMTLCLAIVTGLASMEDPTRGSTIAAAFFLCLYLLIWGGSWALVSWVYISEISPLRYRHVGTPLGLSSMWMSVFITTYASPIGFVNVGWKMWFLFLCFGVVTIPFVYFCCPETQGLTLEEIDIIFMTKEKQQSEQALRLAYIRDYSDNNKVSTENTDV